MRSSWAGLYSGLVILRAGTYVIVTKRREWPGMRSPERRNVLRSLARWANERMQKLNGTKWLLGSAF